MSTLNLKKKGEYDTLACRVGCSHSHKTEKLNIKKRKKKKKMYHELRMH